jgi:hypothetical protein
MSIKRIQILISVDQLAWLDKQTGPFVSRTAVVRNIINEAMEKEDFPQLKN